MSKKNRKGGVKPIILNTVQIGYLAKHFDVHVMTIQRWAERGYDRLLTPEAQDIIKKYQNQKAEI